MGILHRIFSRQNGKPRTEMAKELVQRRAQLINHTAEDATVRGTSFDDDLREIDRELDNIGRWLSILDR